jgi:hypothetical protein
MAFHKKHIMLTAFIFNRQTAKWTRVADMKVEKGHVSCGLAVNNKGEKVIFNKIFHGF